MHISANVEIANSSITATGASNTCRDCRYNFDEDFCGLEPQSVRIADRKSVVCRHFKARGG